MSEALFGVISEGLMMTVFPAAIADTRDKGKVERKIPRRNNQTHSFALICVIRF